MEQFLADNGSTKRLGVGLAAMLAAALSNKLGISQELALGILGLAGVMITGSNWKAATAAGAVKAEAVKAPSDAVKVFNEVQP